MTCPVCHDQAAWTRCWECGWTEEASTTDASPATRAKVPDTRLEDERKADARSAIEALGWIIWDAEQGYRPDACEKCGEPYPGGHSTRVTLGFPDQVVLGHGIITFLEWKSHTGKPSPSQKLRAADCARAGVPYAVVRTTAEAVEFLRGLRGDF